MNARGFVFIRFLRCGCTLCPVQQDSIESNSAVIWQQMCEKVSSVRVPTVYLPSLSAGKDQISSSSERPPDGVWSWWSPLALLLLRETSTSWCIPVPLFQRDLQILMESSISIGSCQLPCHLSSISVSPLLPATPFVTFTIALKPYFPFRILYRPPWSKSFTSSICQFKPFHFPVSTVQPLSGQWSD